MNYDIVRKNLTKPKKVRIKKEKIEFTDKAIKLRANFIVPNKKAYSVSKEINDKRLNDEMYAVFRMNNILNTHSFYSRDYVYQCGTVSFVGEYFCRFFGYDGIFIKTKIIENPDDYISPFKIDEDNAKIYIKNINKDSIKHNDATLSTSYLFSTLYVLGLFKQYENSSFVLNLKGHTILDEYLCLLHVMDTALSLYNQKENKTFFMFDKNNSISFYTFAYICKALITYYPIFIEKIEEENQQTFIMGLMANLNKFCYSNTENRLLNLNELISFDESIVKYYKLHFGRRENAQSIINNLHKFNTSILDDDYKIMCSWINQCVKIYCESFIKNSFSKLPNYAINLLKQIISVNGYNLSAQLCKGFEHFYNGEIKLYNYYFNQYNEKIPYNKFKIKEKLKKLSKIKN